MAGNKAAWGIEVGSYAVKALRLERNGDQLVVSDFGEFAHKKPLSTPDLDVDEMIRLTLGQLVSQKNFFQSAFERYDLRQYFQCLVCHKVSSNFKTFLLV